MTKLVPGVLFSVATSGSAGTKQCSKLVWPRRPFAVESRECASCRGAATLGARSANASRLLTKTAERPRTALATESVGWRPTVCVVRRVTRHPSESKKIRLVLVLVSAQARERTPLRAAADGLGLHKRRREDRNKRASSSTWDACHPTTRVSKEHSCFNL